MQPKLLRALQEKEIERIGGIESIPVNVRVISASNMPLDVLVEQGKFRRDLYYRLNIMTIKIPPLRERKEDILPLANSFIEKYNAETFKTVSGIDDESADYLINYNWPGNVRELQNVIERAMASTVSDRLELKDFKKFNPEYNAFTEIGNTGFENSAAGSLSEQKADSERRAIIKALEASGHNKAKTARMLNISRTLLYKKLEKYNIS
jgi:transcriptional regulator with PAS, ATPase and Fis domain